MRQIALRIVATFAYNATAVVGSAQIIGGVPLWKAAVMAGFAATFQVIQRLASAYMADGYLTLAEIEDAFGDEDDDA
jgi:hypothetical protein